MPKVKLVGLPVNCLSMALWGEREGRKERRVVAPGFLYFFAEGDGQCAWEKKRKRKRGKEKGGERKARLRSVPLTHCSNCPFAPRRRGKEKGAFRRGEKKGGGKDRILTKNLRDSTILSPLIATYFRPRKGGGREEGKRSGSALSHQFFMCEPYHNVQHTVAGHKKGEKEKKKLA